MQPRLIGVSEEKDSWAGCAEHHQEGRTDNSVYVHNLLLQTYDPKAGEEKDEQRSPAFQLGQLAPASPSQEEPSLSLA